VKLNSRKGIRLGLVAGLVATGLVGVTSLTAAGSGDRPPVSYGTLRITLTDRAGMLTLVRASDGATFTQALGVSTPCSTLVADDILDSSGAVVEDTLNLLNFGAAVAGGSSPNVQLPSNGIGVTDGANCGDPSGLVGPGETLTLDLGGYLPGDVKVSTGTLRIGKSRGSDGNLRLAYDGGSFGNEIPVSPGVVSVPVAGDFRSISIRSTANQSSRGLSLRTDTVFNLVAPAPATAPGAPTEVTAVRGNGLATVEWTAPVDDGGSVITGYTLEYRAAGSSAWTTFSTTATSGAIVTPLTNGTEYTFRVAAVNDVGTSLFTESDAVTPASAPDAPTNVTVVGGAVRTTVSWTAPADDGGLPPVTYELQYLDTSDPETPIPVTVDPATATSQDVTGLAPGTYVFEVRAGTEAGNSAWVASDPVTIVALPVDCGGTVQVNGVDGDIADSVTFLRGENQDKPGENVAGECLEVDATVKIVTGDTTSPEGVADYVFWDNTFEDVNGEIQRVNATVTIDWAPVLAADSAELNRLIDYDGPTGPALYRETLWCESFEQISDDPVTYSAVLPDWTYTDGIDGSILVIENDVEVRKAPWCLVSDTRVQQGGQIFQTEVLYGSGDPSRTSSFR
jgi:hypothetical protein